MLRGLITATLVFVVSTWCTHAGAECLRHLPEYGPYYTVQITTDPDYQYAHLPTADVLGVPGYKIIMRIGGSNYVRLDLESLSDPGDVHYLGEYGIPSGYFLCDVSDWTAKVVDSGLPTERIEAEYLIDITLDRFMWLRFQFWPPGSNIGNSALLEYQFVDAPVDGASSSVGALKSIFE